MSLSPYNIEETRNLICACWLTSLYGFGRKKHFQLQELCGSPSAIYQLTQDEMAALYTEKTGELWQHYKNTVHPEKLYEKYQRQGIRFTYWQMPDFPNKLRDIPDAPYGIYYKGSLPKEGERSVAMIGARRCSDYGRCMAEYFADKFGKMGIAVISGMASGIDGISQRAALAAGGTSYGVLGCGVDIIYPENNADLYRNLIARGGVISEYPPTTQPKAGLFPQRNRIISALSDVVLVVEARAKSGTLITVDMALEQGREVYVVPGRCTDNLSIGCNRLLRQGAIAATAPEDIMQDMRWLALAQDEPAPTRMPLSQTAADILAVLDILPCTQDDIISALANKQQGYTIPQVCQGLLELELADLATRSGGLYRRKKVAVS